MAKNPFDQFDSAATPNTFDQFDNQPESAKPASAARKMGDLALSFGKGVIAVPEAAVGLADLVTGGHAGKAAEAMGVRFKDAKDVLSDWQSDDLKDKQRKFQQADGVIDKTGVAVSNPSLISNAVAESVPLMGAGGVGARGVMTALPKAGAVGAGAIGEGIAGAGSAGEQIRQETKDGLLTGKQAALAGASGVATAGFGAAGGKAAKALGIGDVDTMIARGATDVAQTAAQAEKGALRRAAEGAISEGFLEELPQSLSEQALQNIALDKPAEEGLADAGVMGVLSGGAMGAGAGVIGHGGHDTKAKDTSVPAVPPVVPPAPAAQLGYSPDPLISFPDGTVGRRSEVDAYVAGLPEDQRPAMRARLMGLAPQPAIPAAPVAPPSAQMGIDPNAGVISKVAAQAVDSGHTQELDLNQKVDEEQLAYEQAMAALERDRAEQDSVDKPITSGPIAESQMSEDDKRAMLFSNQAVADGGQSYVGTQDGDILNGMGAPFATRMAAARRANMEGKDWTIAPVFDGWVARRKDAFNGASNGVSGATTGRSEQGSDQPAPGVGLGDPDGNGVGADAPGRADDAVGESRQLSGGVDDAAVNAETNKPLAPVKSAQAATETIANVQDAAPATTGTQAEAAPVEARTPVESDAAQAADLPGAGSAPVESAGVEQAPKTASKADLDHLFGVDKKRAKAIARIAKGTAFFGTNLKAAQFINENGLKDTHEFVKTGASRFEVRAKAVAEKSPATHSERKTRISSALANGGHVVGADLRDRTGLRLMGLTPEELSTIPADKVRAKPNADAARTDSTTNQGSSNGTQAPQAQQTEAQQSQERAPGQSVGESLPPTDIRVGDKVLVNGKPHTVTQGVEGGIAAESDAVEIGSGVKISQTTFLKGDDAIRAKIEADKAGLNAKPAADDKPTLKKAQDKRKAENEGLHMATGRADFAAGKPRVLPSQYTKPGDKNSKDWYRGWDAANLAAPDNNTQTADAAEFVAAPDGSIDFGEITPEMSKAMRRQAGKIRLTRGMQNADGTGYGLMHIEANHGRQIRGLGFGTVQDFVAHVASGIQQVWQVPGSSQLLVTAKDGRKDVMYIRLEISKEGDYYRVNSAFPVRQEDYESLKGMKKIWDGSEPTSTVSGQRPAFATAASASPETESSQGSSNARGQESSVAAAAESVKKPNRLKKAEQDREQARADYFTPGNIVKSYGGHDEVLAYLAPTKPGGAWSVRVHAIAYKDGQWVRLGRPQDARMHSTQPEAKNLAAGPVARLGYAKASEVKYSESRGDGRSHPNAVDRGVAPKTEVKDEFSGLISDEENAKLDVRHKAIDSKIDALNDDQVRELYAKANLAGGKQGIFAMREVLKLEHPDDIEPLLGISSEATATSPAPEVKAPFAEGKEPSVLANSAKAATDSVAESAQNAEKQEPAFDGVDTAPVEQPDAPKDEKKAPTSKTPKVDTHVEAMAAVRDGKATPEQYKASFAAVADSEEAVKAELNTKTKDALLRAGGPYFAMRSKGDAKPKIVDAMYQVMLDEYALGKQYGPTSYMMGRGMYEAYLAQRAEALRALVDGQTAETLADYAAEVAGRREEVQAERAKRKAAIENPKTLADFRVAMSAMVDEGKTSTEARLSLTPEQRVKLDELLAESTREARETRKRAAKTEIRAAGQDVGGEIIATKHARDGYDLFVVKPAERVSREDYATLLGSAKRMGGWYSAFRGNGAIPGFQFKDREQATAFLKLVAGDTTDAQAQAEQRRDSFEDDRSQTAVERLTEMADRLEARATASLGVERKANTDRRARFAAAAEASARADEAMAKTMRNLSVAIGDGKAKFLDTVRQKTQVEMLSGMVRTAVDNQLRAKYPSYAEQEKHKGEKPTELAADYAEFPSFTAYRSDLASLARQLLDVDGTKQIGQRLMKVADDLSEAYLEFAKANLLPVSQFGRGGQMADFASREVAERAIKRSGLVGKAIVLPIKRGENRVVLSPSEAINRGVWKGDGDKRITLTPEFGVELVGQIGRKAGKRVTVPWQFENANRRLKALSRMSIETPAEFRSALREFIRLQEQPAAADKVKELERSMIGHKKDGLDFFPTPKDVADEMVEAAGIEPGMSVLEPSAGMGHIAERIREAGVEPDVVEMSSDRRELLEAKGFTLVGSDFLQVQGQYDRIVMNPPFSARRDAEHVQHAYSMLKPGGRLVAIMGEGIFFGKDKKADDFRAWLEQAEGTDEKLDEGTFMDPSLPVNTGANARMVVVEKPMNPKQVPEPEAPAMSRVRPTFSRGAQVQANESVETIAMAIASKWEGSPEIVVAFDMNDPIIPENVRKEDQRQRSGGATGTPEGFYYKGVVYLMSSKLGTTNDVARVLFHEALGHAGLRGAFGGALKPILRDVAALRRAEVEAKMKQYGLKGVSNMDRMIAAEEVLAELAQTRPDIGFVKRAIAAIRTWLRQNVPGFNSLRLTDDELVRNYILPARRFVENGGGPKGKVRVEPTFSRGTNDAMTNSNVVGNQGGRSADDTTPSASFDAQAAFEKRGGVGDVNESADIEMKSNIFAEMAASEGYAVSDRGAKYFNITKSFGLDADGYDKKAVINVRVSDHSNVNRGIHFGEHDINIAPDDGYSRDTFQDALWKIKSAYVNDDFDTVIPDVSAPSDARLGYAIATEQAQRGKPSDGSDGNPTTNESSAPDDGGAMFSRTLGDTLATAANNVHDVSLPAGYTVGDLLKAAPGKVNWWHKTVGTMYNLAERSPQFKRVFDGVQHFINDVSYYATEAADLAPSILPKLETWKDITKSPLSAEDTKAISAPIFEGTLTWARDEAGKPIKIEALEAQTATLTPEQKAQRLLRNDKLSEQVLKMWQGLPLDQYEAIINGKYERDMLKAGVVWTDAELRTMFNLTNKQIPLYREFRKATDKSLTNLAISDMLRFGGKDVEAVRAKALESGDAMQAAVLLRDHLLALADSNTGRSDVLMDTANKMIEKADKAQDLITRGYAPLSRYGQFTLDVVDRDGERVYFGMFESKVDAARMARRMEQEYPGATITRGTVSEEEYKLFSGVSPETLELFGDMLGLEAQGDSAASKAFQTYLKLAKSNRSSMKRMIQRKGIAGFSEDSGRVLAGFVYSNARQTASNLHMGEMTDAANEVAKTQGELKDQAVRLVDYVKNPREEAQAFRGLLFAQYIGGSVASAMVNMTQPIAMTFPWLHQYTSVSSAAKEITAAMRDANKKLTGNAKLDAALKRAEEDGTVSPQEVHQLMRQSQGRGVLQSGDGTRVGNAMAAGNNFLSRVSLGWGKLFSLAEQFNRRATFIAAYRVAVDKGMDAPEAFARKAIAETQGVYNKGNKPNWARGAVGSTLFTFKQYSIAYVEMLHRMATQGGPEGKKAALLALGVLFLMSGAGGLPGADDLDDLISGAMQRLGYNFDSRTKRQEFFAGLVGEGGAKFLESGISGLPGMPLDVSGRLGMGNLIPGTGLLVKKADHTRDLAEVAGPGGDFAQRGFDAAGKVLDGDVFGANGAVATMAPKAIQNLYKSYDMANMGMYRDAKGMKVLDTDGADAMLKAIGFQPNDVKKVQDASLEAQRMIGLNKLRETEIANRWALGIFEKDADKVKAARDELAQWNAANPESPIRINFRQVLQRVQKMNQSKEKRLIATAPKEIRSEVRRALSAE